MANYPSVITALTNPLATQKLNAPSHSGIETAQNTDITAIETFIGVEGNSSTVGTLIYDIRSPASNGGGHVQVANKGGTGQTTFTKGDILVAQSSSVLSKLAVGTDAYVLVSDSTQQTGVKWTAGSSVLSGLVSTSLGQVTQIVSVLTGTPSIIGIAHGLLAIPKLVKVFATYASTGSPSCISNLNAQYYLPSAGPSVVSYLAESWQTGTGINQQIQTAQFLPTSDATNTAYVQMDMLAPDATNIRMSWVKTANQIGNVILNWEAHL